MKIAHLIFTRYNLSLTFKNVKKKIERNDSWLEKREKLFRDIYLKCVLHSKSKYNILEKFNIFCDFRHEQLSNYRNLEKINIINTNPPTNENMKKIVNNMIKEYLNSLDFDLVIATRLDSDDGLNYNYTDKLIEYIFSKKILKNKCVYFEKFVQLRLNDHKFSLRSEKNPNVLSFLNFRKSQEILNPGNYNHAIVDRSIDTDKIKEHKPMFVQSIHDINVGNEFKEKSYLGGEFQFLIRS